MITLVTAWYPFKAKFDESVYHKWISYFLDNVQHFYLVVFTDEANRSFFETFSSPYIRIIIKKPEEFYCHKYSHMWKLNHQANEYLNHHVDWKVNMLWSEKIAFVKETIEQKYFDTDWYGWCDIGYFRCRPYLDISQSTIRRWPNIDTIKHLDTNKIYYCQVCSDELFTEIIKTYSHLNEKQIPKIPPTQISIAGGFFLLHHSHIDWWYNTYYQRLELYFTHSYLVKDDQIIILDCIIHNLSNFELIKHINNSFDPWFGFQTFLL